MSVTAPLLISTNTSDRGLSPLHAYKQYMLPYHEMSVMSAPLLIWPAHASAALCSVSRLVVLLRTAQLKSSSIPATVQEEVSPL